MRKPLQKPRNVEIAHGVMKYGRSESYVRRGLLRHKKAGKPFNKTVAKKEAPKKALPARFYPADNVPVPLPSRKSHHKAPKIRRSLVPGTVLILLAGRFKGRRVVLISVLKSGLLLITGPYKINGVPARRVNPAYVIATSTHVDLSHVNVPTEFTDSFFRKEKKEEGKKTEEKFFKRGEKKPKKELPAERKALQKKLDDQIVPLVGKVNLLKQYLASRFSLSNGHLPHEMKF